MFLHATGVEKTNGFEKRAICCGKHKLMVLPRSLLAPAPAAPGLATGDFGVDAPSSVFGETPALRAEFENRANGTSQVGSPSRPTTLRPAERAREDRRAVRERVDIFARSSKKTRELPVTGDSHFFRTYVNDPSAGSPTDTLLRLLRPLPQIICPTSQPNDHGQADHGTHPYRSLTGTIGRSDGRCVQRAGT